MAKEQEHQELSPAEKEETAAVKVYRENIQALYRIDLQIQTPPKEVKDKVPSDIDTVSGHVLAAEESLLQLRRLRGDRTNGQKMYFYARYVDLYSRGINASAEWRGTLEENDQRKLWDSLRTSYSNSFTRLQNIAKHRKLNPRN